MTQVQSKKPNGRQAVSLGSRRLRLLSSNRLTGKKKQEQEPWCILKPDRNDTDSNEEAPVPRIQVGHERPEIEQKDLLDEKLEKCPRFD